MFYAKQTSRTIKYRDHKNFNSIASRMVFFLSNSIHIQQGQKKLNKKQLNIQWTQHLFKLAV